MSSHFSGLHLGITVERAHSPPLLHRVITLLPLALLSPVGGAVARLQVGLIVRGLVLRFGADKFHRFHVCVRFKLRAAKKKKKKCRERMRRWRRESECDDDDDDDVEKNRIKPRSVLLSCPHRAAEAALSSLILWTE